MKIITRNLLCTVLCAILLVVGCGQSKDETDAGSSIDLYITNTLSDWSASDEVAVNGHTYPLSSVEGSTAKVCTEGEEGPFCISYPAARFIREEESYSTLIPSVQEYRHGGPSPATAVAVDYSVPSTQPFRTSTLTVLAGFVCIDVYSDTEFIPDQVVLTSADGQSTSGEIIAECRTGAVRRAGNGSEGTSLTFPRDGLKISTDSSTADRLWFAVIPGTYPQGLEIRFHTRTGATVLVQVPDGVTVESGEETVCGTFCLKDSGHSRSIGVGTSILNGSVIWAEGASLNINGTRSTATSSSAGIAYFPTLDASEWYAAYPDACVTSFSDGIYTMTIPSVQPYHAKGTDTEPVMAGYNASASGMTITQLNGIFRFDLSTAPGLKRMIREVAVSADGAACSFTVDPRTGSVTRTASLGDIQVRLAEPIQESSDRNAPTSFSVTMLPGTYKDLKVRVRAYDGSIHFPEELTEEDLTTETTYHAGDITIEKGKVSTVTLPMQVVAYDWIKPNGSAFVGARSLQDSQAAVIDTGWLVPDANGHSVEYECQMSGALENFRCERILFGAQGSGSNKPVFLVFNETAAASGWYATQASVAGRDTYKQETGGKVFHMDRELSDLRTVIIGTEGKFKSSYIYFKMRNDRKGETGWTELSDRSDYFKFTGGSLQCQYPVTLFAKNNGNLSGPVSELRIHGFKIRYDGVLKMDMQACTVDGIPGMTDKVGGTFHFNICPNVIVVPKNGSNAPFLVGYNEELPDCK